MYRIRQEIMILMIFLPISRIWILTCWFRIEVVWWVEIIMNTQRWVVSVEIQSHAEHKLTSCKIISVLFSLKLCCVSKYLGFLDAHNTCNVSTCIFYSYFIVERLHLCIICIHCLFHHEYDVRAIGCCSFLYLVFTYCGTTLTLFAIVML